MPLSHVRPSRLLAVAGLAVAITAGTAFAGGGEPSISEVSATFSLDPVRDNPVQCVGEDGNSYVQDVAVYLGTQASGNQDLNGNQKVVVHSLTNNDTGDGIDFGPITVKDPKTGEVTSSGMFIGVIKSGVQNRGLEIDVLESGEVMIGNFSVLIDPDTGHVDGEFGADPSLVPSDPAIVWNGQGCEDFSLAFRAALGSIAGRLGS